MTEQVPSKATSKDIKTFIESLEPTTKVDAAKYVFTTFYDIIDLPTKRYVRNVMNLDIVLTALHTKYPPTSKDEEKLEGEAEHMKVFQKYIERLVDKIVTSKYEYSADDSEDLSELFNS